MSLKAVILAAGEGNRLRPLTSSRPKPLIPIAGKPLLEHTILGLKSAGIDHILLIVGYKEDKIKDYFGNGFDKFGVTIEYVTQEEYLGTAHATGYARYFVGDSNFLMMYGDLLVDPVIFQDVVKKFEENNPEGLISLLEVKNPEEFGIISLDSDGYVNKITEKPPPELNLGNLANAGIYIFKPLIFEAIEKTKKSVRDEYEFTESMDILIKQLKGKIIGNIIKDKFWSDIGLPWQFLDANNYLLDNLVTQKLGRIEKGVSIKGTIHVGEGTKIKSRTVIKGPVYIGKNCLIGPNAVLKPYTCIEDNCSIGHSEIDNSIIFSNSNIAGFNSIQDSILCENVNLGAGTKIANRNFDDSSIKVKIKDKLVDSKRLKLGAIIGPNVKIGINVSIMCGKVIGENSIIEAHTLVNKDVSPGSLYYQDPDIDTKKNK